MRAVLSVEPGACYTAAGFALDGLENVVAGVRQLAHRADAERSEPLGDPLLRADERDGVDELVGHRGEAPDVRTEVQRRLTNDLTVSAKLGEARRLQSDLTKTYPFAPRYSSDLARTHDGLGDLLFAVVNVALIVIGTFFRGPGWALVPPWVHVAGHE